MSSSSCARRYCRSLFIAFRSDSCFACFRRLIAYSCASFLKMSFSSKSRSRSSVISAPSSRSFFSSCCRSIPISTASFSCRILPFRKSCSCARSVHVTSSSSKSSSPEYDVGVLQRDAASPVRAPSSCSEAAPSLRRSSSTVASWMTGTPGSICRWPIDDDDCVECSACAARAAGENDACLAIEVNAELRHDRERESASSVSPMFSSFDSEVWLMDMRRPRRFEELRLMLGEVMWLRSGDGIGRLIMSSLSFSITGISRSMLVSLSDRIELLLMTLPVRSDLARIDRPFFGVAPELARSGPKVGERWPSLRGDPVVNGGRDIVCWGCGQGKDGA
eukprot:Rhum_TRINITY_DN14497_c30_g1::Rhum_TRINITY_DN14497_c30_g1_i1::g.93281::m.93281